MANYDDTARLKDPPKSAEAEQAVIGALFLDNSQWDNVSEAVSSNDFFYSNNRHIFQAIFEQAEGSGHKFDILTTANRLREKNQLEEVGGMAYLQRIGMETPSVVNAVAYAKIIREHSIKRRLISASNEIANSAFFPDGKDAKELLDQAESKIFTIAEQYHNNKNEGLIHAKKPIAETLQYLQQVAGMQGGVTGLSTGLRDLDEMTSGLHNGELIIVAGRPSMGKTAFSLNIAQNIALGSGLPVAIFSLEMPARALIMRMIASLGRIPSGNLQKGQLDQNDMNKLRNAAIQIGNAPIYIDDSSNLSITDLRARVRRLAREHGQLGLVLIDYLTLMQMPDAGNNNRVTQIGDLSRGLKLLAKEIDAPVMVLSQLSREVEKRVDKHPQMSDLRDSGAIEQDADIIMFVYREAVYNKETGDPNKAEIVIAKQRNGPIGTVFLHYKGEYSLFDNAAYGDAPDDY